MSSNSDPNGQQKQGLLFLVFVRMVLANYICHSIWLTEHDWMGYELMI